MSGFKLAEISGDLTSITSWERLAKYCVIHLIVGIFITILIFATLAVFGRCSLLLSGIIIIGIILSGHAIILSWYENWRGCNLQV